MEFEVDVTTAHAQTSSARTTLRASEAMHMALTRSSFASRSPSSSDAESDALLKKPALRAIRAGKISLQTTTGEKRNTAVWKTMPGVESSISHHLLLPASR